MQEVWVYSLFMAQNIGAVAPVPGRRAAAARAATRPSPPSRCAWACRDGFLFLFVFDYLSTVQRKNPVGLVEAFRQAFAPGEGPQLLIKTINGPLRPLSEEEVLWAAHGREDIHVIDRSLSGEELRRADGRVRLLRVAASRRGVRADARRGYGDRQAGDRDRATRATSTS